MKTQDYAYVLHRRPFQDTSLLVDFFTQNHGIITAVCRGARKNKKKQPLEGFNPFWIEYDGRHQLATLYQYEPAQNSEINPLNQLNSPINLIGNQLYCGLYLNELLIKLLGRHDPYPELYLAYQTTLNQLQLASQSIEKALRHFELYLLNEIGYGIPLEKTEDTHDAIQENAIYYYNPQLGFSEAKANIIIKSTENHPYVFSGKTLINIQQEDFTDTQTLKDAKRLIRLTLDFLLERHGGNSQLKSRELFMR